MTCTPDDFKQSWKRMKERTSSHNIHFGHFQTDCENKDNLMVHYIMAEVPFHTGFCPKC